METAIVTSDDTGDNAEVQAAELNSVAAAGGAAGAAAVHAESAELAAQEAAALANGTGNAASAAMEAAEVAQDAADRAVQAEYATAEQAERMLGMQEQIMTALSEIAEKATPAPSSKPRQGPPRDKAPAKGEHFLRRKVGKKS